MKVCVEWDAISPRLGDMTGFSVCYDSETYRIEDGRVLMIYKNGELVAAHKSWKRVYIKQPAE